MAPRNPWLLTGGLLSAAAAFIHIAIIFGGGDWYRFFGAGEGMARMAEAGWLRPHAIALGIAGLLGLASAYAFAGAGLIRGLPLMRTALTAISAVYLLRGLAAVPILLWRPETGDAFLLWSSAIVLIYGVTYAVGTWRAWAFLSRRQD